MIGKKLVNLYSNPNFDYLMCITQAYDLEVDNKIGLAYNFFQLQKKSI